MRKREGPDRRAPRGVQILHDPRLNKGTAFTEAERDALGLRGLLPPRVFTQEEQEQRILANLRRLVTPLDKYLLLVALLDRNEQLFYRTGGLDVQLSGGLVGNAACDIEHGNELHPRVSRQIPRMHSSYTSAA